MVTMYESLDKLLLTVRQEALAMFNHASGDVVKQPQRPKRQRVLLPILHNSVIDETIGAPQFSSATSSNNFKIDLYYPTVDHILTEMREHFTFCFVFY